MGARHYTPEEDKIIINAVKRNPQNLKKTFEELVTVLNRSYASIKFHYYQKIAKDPTNKLFLTVSQRKKHTNYKIYKKGMKVKPEQNYKSKWQRILAILFE